MLAAGLAHTEQDQACINTRFAQISEQSDCVALTFHARAASGQTQPGKRARQRRMFGNEAFAPVAVGAMTMRKLERIDRARDDAQAAGISLRIMLEDMATHRLRHANHALAARHHAGVEIDRIQPVHGGDESWSCCPIHAAPRE